MVYIPMKQWDLLGFRKSSRKGKMYDAILINKKDTTKKKYVPFGSNKHQNFSDRTGRNLYPKLIHGDQERRKRYIARHKGFVRKGFYSPGYFSMVYLWS